MNKAERQELIERIDGRPVVASFSGGKDSTAMCLHLIDLGVPFTPVFLDTGWEHPLTYEYVKAAPAWLGVDVVWVKSTKRDGFADMVRREGAFPSRVTRFCTRILKTEPFRDYIATLPDEPVNAVGVRAGESAARAKLAAWERWPFGDCDVWRPVLSWTEADVIDIHRRHGVAPNSLYLKGATRVGCFPCIFARKSEIRLVADLSPGRVDEIARLESDLSKAAGAPRTFFHGRSDAVGVRDVVSWARTSRGGRQLLLFDDAEPGCMRWGMCEHPEAAK